jgi:hypothetical protein
MPREGTPVDPGLSLADMLPPDKADRSGILQAGFALVEALSSRCPTAGPMTVTVTLDAAGWTALEAETRRPYRGHAAYKYTPAPSGAGAVRWVKNDPAQMEPSAEEGDGPIVQENAGTRVELHHGVVR